jgi:hypothetical protein
MKELIIKIPTKTTAVAKTGIASGFIRADFLTSLLPRLLGLITKLGAEALGAVGGAGDSGGGTGGKLDRESMSLSRS